jgi:hypothetical protein
MASKRLSKAIGKKELRFSQTLFFKLFAKVKKRSDGFRLRVRFCRGEEEVVTVEGVLV